MNIDIRIHVTPVDGRQAAVLDISAPRGSTWQQLRDALGDLVSDETEADGRTLMPSDVIGSHPLIDGACLEPARKSAHAASILQVVVTDGPTQGHSVALSDGVHMLGRDHVLAAGDHLASRQHTRLTLSHGEVVVTDLGSVNGTFLDGMRIPPGVATGWSVGQHLRVGATELRLDVERTPWVGVADGFGHLIPPDRPRARPPVTHVIRLPQPPHTVVPARMRWAAVLIPIPVALVLAVALKNALFLMFVAVGPLVVLASLWEDRRRAKRDGRVSHAEHRRLTREAASQAAAALSHERARRREVLPAPDLLPAIASGARAGLGSQETAEVLLLRLGHGSAPSAVKVERDAAKFSVLDLDDAPVGLAIRRGATVHLDCPERLMTRVVEHVTAHLLTSGVPGGGTPRVLIPDSRDARWIWVPSAIMLDASGAPPSPAAPSMAGTAVRSKDEILVLDGRTTGAEVMAVGASASGTTVLWIGPRCPVPADDHVVIKSGHLASRLPTGHAFTFDQPSPAWFPAVTATLRRWVPRRMPQTDEALPHLISPADVLPQGNLRELWSNPTMSVPIGIGTAGVIPLDLRVAGPHALVAGTTGSGKSEFLLGYLRGLLTLNSPETVHVVLIDYKGGATFGPLAQAPHVVGLITDLDGSMAERALIGLRAEIRRREHILKEGGFSAYDDYVKSAGSEGDTPHKRLARLIVIVDEFRVLAEELPDFVTGLVRLAAVGRSLGIHLVLATQRPGGVVTADMRANLDARIALRVRERVDSLDVIDVPSAAMIPRTLPGRAYLAIGGEAPVEVQTVYTGTPRPLSTAHPALHVHSVAGSHPGPCRACTATYTSKNDLDLFIAECRAAHGQRPRPDSPVLAPLPPVVTDPELGTTLLGRGQVSWAHLAEADPPHTVDRSPESGKRVPTVAVLDLPANQSQPAVVADSFAHIGITGAPRSGRTTAARRVAEAAHERGEEVWWVGVDPPGPPAEITNPDDPSDVASLLTRFATSDGGCPATLVVDGWERLQDSLLRINRGTGVEDMMALIQRAHHHGVRLCVTGGRAVLGSKLAPLLDLRVVLRQHDASEYSLAGLRPHQVPAVMPPGRALALPHGHQLQFLLPRTAAETSVSHAQALQEDVPSTPELAITDLGAA